MPRVRPLFPDQPRRTLANRLAKTADRIRQIATNMGVRPYRVFLVWTTFDGPERGEGNEVLLARKEILPTPKVPSLESLQEAAYSGGVLVTGTLRVERVSLDFTRYELLGRDIPGRGIVEQIPDNIDFFWEVDFDDRQRVEGDKPFPTRYRVSGEPSYRAGGTSWTVTLERQDEARSDQDGALPFSPRG